MDTICFLLCLLTCGKRLLVCFKHFLQFQLPFLFSQSTYKSLDESTDLIVVCVLCSAVGLQSSRGYLGERIRTWEGQRGLSFLQNMELRAGELLVPRAGLYYIYAQTYFRLSSTRETEEEANGETEDTKEEEGAQLVQYIYKKVWLCFSHPAHRVSIGIIWHWNKNHFSTFWECLTNIEQIKKCYTLIWRFFVLFFTLAHRWVPTWCPFCSWNPPGVSAGPGARSPGSSPCIRPGQPFYSLPTASSSP